MFDLFQRLTEGGFMPHGHCYQWRSDLLVLHAGSDALIALSYFAIPGILAYVLRRRSDVDFRRMFVMFAAFITLCGLAHLAGIWTIWNGTYFLSGGVKLATGVVSAATAVMLVAAVPRALSLPSPQQLEGANEELRREVEIRRRAEAALSESEERFRQAFEHAAIGKAIVARDGRWMQVNPALCAITGYTHEELLGMTFQDITHPDDLEEDVTLLQKMLDGELETYGIEKRYMHRDGRPVWVLLNVSAVRDEDSAVKYFISEMMNISDQKRWEDEQARLLADVEADRDKLRRTERALEDANRTLEHRNRELQEFAFVASHDLKEPLRKISAFVDLVRAEHGPQFNENSRHYLDRIQDAAIRTGGLLSDLLDYSRVTTNVDRFRQVDVEAVLNGILVDLELLINECEAVIQAESLPTIEADPTQIRQLLHHLISNALKYRRDGVRPVINIRGCVENDPPACRIIVADNGIGFDQKYATRIFLPFERLHGRRYPGTGMGLAICRRIVERHRGVLTAESREGDGTDMVVILPVRQTAHDDTINTDEESTHHGTEE